MTEKRNEIRIVDALLEDAREEIPSVPTRLMTQVHADALSVQAGFAPSRDRQTLRTTWREMFRVLGGWPAMAGLTTAAVCGVWLGVFPPGILSDATVDYLGLNDTIYLLDTADGLGFDLFEEAL